MYGMCLCSLDLSILICYNGRLIAILPQEMAWTALPLFQSLADMTPSWRIEMLGGLRVYRDDRLIAKFATQKAAMLLARLAMPPGRHHSREELAELLWPESEPETSRHNLRQSLSSLRRQLEPPGIPASSVLLADRTNLCLQSTVISTDVAEFEAALRAGNLGLAAAIYHGIFLPGFYDDWVITERERLAHDYLETLRHLIAAYDHEGAYERALSYARRAVSLEPDDEEMQHSVIRLMIQTQRMTEATRYYRNLKRRLSAEGRTPAVEMQALIRKASRSHPVPASVSPLLNNTDPVTTAPAGLAPLPLFPTLFFGREQELEQVRHLLSRGARLVTLTGTAGMGKTRLAAEVVRQGKAAASFVALADLRDPNLLLETIRDTFNLPSVGSANPLEQVAAVLEIAPAVLVLDNLEHLGTGAGPVVSTLLARVPTLTILATSRLPLGLDGEHEFPVPPLPFPSEGQPPLILMENPSVRLFTDRAQAIRPDFQVTPRNADAVAALCRCLEGLPLALELAAPWIQTQTPAQMLSRMSARFDLLVSRRRRHIPRHLSLRVALDWSYDLLTQEEQRFFLRLSIFRGGCTLDSADAVCGENETLALLTRLCEHSLVMAVEDGDTMRFRLLEALREYGMEKLSGNDWASLAVRHCDCFLALAEEATPHMNGPQQKEWLERLETEHDNLRAALEWALAERRGQTALRLAGALSWFWRVRGHWHEGRDYLSRAVQAAPDPSQAMLYALHGAVRLAAACADNSAAEILAQRFLAMARQLGDILSEGRALRVLGMLRLSRGESIAAWQLLKESLVCCEQQKDLFEIANALHSLGSISYAQGELDTAHVYYERALAIRRSRDDYYGIANTLHNLAAIRYELTDVNGAVARWTEAHKLFQEIADQENAAAAQTALGCIALHAGDLTQARQLLEEAQTILNAVGSKIQEGITLNSLGELKRKQADFAGARKDHSRSLSLLCEAGEKRRIAQSLEGIAALAVSLGDLTRAARLIGAAESLRISLGAPMELSRHPAHNQTIAAVCASLVDGAFTAAYAAGRSLSWESAVAEAFALLS